MKDFLLSTVCALLIPMLLFGPRLTLRKSPKAKYTVMKGDQKWSTKEYWYGDGLIQFESSDGVYAISCENVTIKEEKVK